MDIQITKREKGLIRTALFFYAVDVASRRYNTEEEYIKQVDTLTELNNLRDKFD